MMETLPFRLHDMNYSQFMHGLKLAGIELDRKVLADIAANQADAFGELVGQARGALDRERQEQPQQAVAA